MALSLPMNLLKDPWILLYSILFFVMIIPVAFLAEKRNEDLAKVYVIKNLGSLFQLDMGAD
jgi:hypothetical protein